jgi:hypothetical protein
MVRAVRESPCWVPASPASGGRGVGEVVTEEMFDKIWDPLFMTKPRAWPADRQANHASTWRIGQSGQHTGKGSRYVMMIPIRLDAKVEMV